MFYPGSVEVVSTEAFDGENWEKNIQHSDIYERSKAS